MSSCYQKQKFKNYFIEVFPQAKELFIQVLQSASIFFQFTSTMKNEQLALKTSYQDIHYSLQEKKARS